MRASFGENRRVHLVGASGSGTTTLGRELAARLLLPFHDTDTFYWLPTEPPFREKREVGERCRVLRSALAQSESWVLSGSLTSWGHEFVADFTAVIFVELSSTIRMARLRAREISRYGSARLEPAGDLHAQYLAFLHWAEGYDEPHNTGRSRAVHERWLAALPATCQVLRVDSERSVNDLAGELMEQLGAA